MNEDELKLVPVPLEEAFPASEGRRLAVVGAGGKTTTIGRLADVQAYRNPPVVVTTTTKTEETPAPGPLHEEVDEAFLSSPTAVSTLARRDDDRPGKLTSPREEDLSRLLKEFQGRILIEADGARGAKLKVHRDFEPVIPEPIDAVLSMFSADVVGSTVGEGTVHAVDRWKQWFHDEEIVTPELITELFVRDPGYAVSDGTHHWLAITHSGGLRQELVGVLTQFPDTFWEPFDRVVVLQNHNIFQVPLNL